MALCSEKEPDTVNSLRPRDKKPHSRQEVKSVQKLTGVDVKSPDVSTDLNKNTWDRSRPVWFQNKLPADNFDQLETRARCNGMRCFQFELGSLERLSFPTILSDKSLNKKRFKKIRQNVF